MILGQAIAQIGWRVTNDEERPSNVVPFPSSRVKPVVSCKSDDWCKREKKRLEDLKETALNVLNSTMVSRGNAVRNYNALAVNINLQIAWHNQQCPHHKVDFLPTYRGPVSVIRNTTPAHGSE